MLPAFPVLYVLFMPSDSELCYSNIGVLNIMKLAIAYLIKNSKKEADKIRMCFWYNTPHANI